MTGVAYTWKFMFLAGFIMGVNSLEFRNFRCNSRRYITNNWFCDGANQCGDNSDESLGCDRKTCGTGKFRCGDGSCKNATIRCNTKKECIDGIDELNCADETEINQCEPRRGKFLCEDKLKCIDYEFTCDGYCNCFDCSDEKSICASAEYCCNTCPHVCFKTPNGLQCCSKVNSLCHDCISTTCDQKCLRFRQQERCFCDENYLGSPSNNGSKCSNGVGHENVLIYSTSNDIKVLNLTANSNFTLQTGVDCAALTASHDSVYYGTYQNNKGCISKISITSTKPLEVVAYSNTNITSIAVDWITSNVYFTNRDSLTACSNSGQVCIRLKTHPAQYITLASKFGLMFWAQNANDIGTQQYIMKSAMDGSEEVFLEYFVFRLPTSLQADELTERIYWLDFDMTEIQSITFYGQSRKVWSLYGQGNIFAFSIFETRVFFTKPERFEIYHSYRSASPSILTVDSNTTAVKLLHAYNPLLQQTKIPNPCNSLCDGLCLLRPSSSEGSLSSTCIHT